jgi:hypothetical protein
MAGLKIKGNTLAGLAADGSTIPAQLVVSSDGSSIGANELVNQVQVVNGKLIDKNGVAPISRTISPIASNAITNMESVSLGNTVVTKNHAVVTYTGVAGDATVDVGFNAEFFTNSANSSDYYCVGTEVRLQSDDSVVEEGSCILNTAKYKIKRRDDVGDNCVFDGLRVNTDVILTNETDAEATVDGVNHSGTDVVIIGDSANTNLEDATYVMDATLYTHISWFMNSNNKHTLIAYNPVTREYMGMVEESSSEGAEIDLTDILGFQTDVVEYKQLNDATDWQVNAMGHKLVLNTDVAAS